MQAGSFPFPVKYGYAAVGRVVAGPAELAGRDVFVLHPHQDRFAAPAAMAVPLPEGLPAGRAVLAANMETALNIVWDSGASAGRPDRGGGGGHGRGADGLALRAAAGDGGDAGRRQPGTGGAGGGARAAASPLPEAAPEDCDLTIHTSASGEGLATALAAAGLEATVVEASWYGDRPPTVGLGGAFHSRRLRLVSSQVGLVPTERRARWSNRRRMEAALGLLTDPALDVLISGETAFRDLAKRYGEVLDRPDTLCHRVFYE